MLTLQKTDTASNISVTIADKSIEDLLNKEWLLTNDRGGYASSTIAGCNTRRYHGLLIGALNPPANRIMSLANCMEMVILNPDKSSRGKSKNQNQKVFNLSTFEFDDKFSPEGFKYIKKFRRDIGIHFDYQLGKLELTKSLYLLHDADTVVLVYDFTKVPEPAEFTLRPFIGLRDFHHLQKSYASFYSKLSGNNLIVTHALPGGCELYLNCPSAEFEEDPQWWFNFVYRKDKQRGQDFTEDLWAPGFFKSRINSPTKIILRATLSNGNEPKLTTDTDIKAVRKSLQKYQSDLITTAKAKKDKFKQLCLAADQFITKRKTPDTQRTTILAGFPWFADWGRDAFIALPGLLLSTGRFDEAKSVLTTFAHAADEGMIPNRFDDRSDTAYFNSVDASLWFINAAFQYLDITGDTETFTKHLLPTVHWIIDSYYNGTKFNIHADTDELINAGNEQTQLTWMDAKYENVAFTPRYGKAVEINALWYNALCLIAQFYTDRDKVTANHYQSVADRVKNSFCKSFWNETTGYLNDCVLPDGSADMTLRPNQIWAVSLPFSPLSANQQKAVVDVIQKNLLTPYGLRTLDTSHSHYKGTYTGPQQQRDEAYHQGTVWSHLIGPFIEAYLKVNDFSKKSKKDAAEFIEPLIQHLTENSCLGSVSEIFDGDSPHAPRGCIAQAWSIAELLRAYKLIN
ncbi:MAG: glycogen debranching enzyme family protein [Planctomycetes bacterium]|nr:glycogen debranching enzyme family protein [Planctomycetota bacterium]